MKKKVLRLVARFSVMACLMMALCLSAFASEGSGGSGSGVDITPVTDALVNGLAGIVPMILTAVGGLAVAGLAIFGAKFAVRAGLGMFRQVTGR